MASFFTSNTFIVLAILVVILILVSCIVSQSNAKKYKRYRDFAERVDNFLNKKEALIKISDVPNEQNITLFRHMDFQSIWNTKFFASWIKGIEEMQVPKEKLFGQCALLVKVYDEMRMEALRDGFRSELIREFAEIPDKLADHLIELCLTKLTEPLKKNEALLSCTPEELYQILIFFRMFTLYKLCQESPATAKNLNMTSFIFTY